MERGSGPPSSKTEVKQVRVQYGKRTMTSQYRKIKPEVRKTIPELSEEELNRERVWTTKCLQLTYYNEEIKALKKGQPVPRSSALAQCTPTLDPEGLLRVGGRLLGTNKLAMGARAPLIVPPIVVKIAKVVLVRGKNPARSPFSRGSGPASTQA